MTDRRAAARNPLACHAPGFQEELRRLGYLEESVGLHLELLSDLGEWLAEHGVDVGELTEAQMRQYVEVRRARGEKRLVSMRGAARTLEYLWGLGVIPTWPLVAGDEPAADLLERYRQYLTSERGITPNVVADYVVEAAAFTRQLDQAGGFIDWTTVSAGNVTQFVLKACANWRKPTFNMLSALRSFLRFVHLEGLIDRPLVYAVPSVARWSGASLPRRLEPDEVKRLLGSCDRHTAGGLRDFAVMTVLVRLGLRACELTRLQLDDIDWRAGELLVCGKGHREEKLPLPGDVGRALTDYLRRGRPSTTDRTVFLRRRAPLRALSPSGVTTLVHGACDRAGLPRVGAHALRHTAVITELLRAGASLGEVGQLLRQRSASATALYAKVDHLQLRTLARPWPGGAP